jgi:hypothetical protein
MGFDVLCEICNSSGQYQPIMLGDYIASMMVNWCYLKTERDFLCYKKCYAQQKSEHTTEDI